MELDGKTIVLTGATSGIGYGCLECIRTDFSAGARKDRS